MNDTWDKLYDAVKTKEFQTIQDNLAQSSDLAIITVDYKGRPLTMHSACRSFCEEIRTMPKYAKLCEKCDAHGGLEAARSKAPFIYLCHANIIDVAVPIIVNDMYLGGIMAGQIRLEDGLEARKQEIEHEIEQIYKPTDLEALFHENPDLRLAYDALPKVPFHKIEATAKILQTICKYMVQNPSEKLLEEITTSVDSFHAYDKTHNLPQEELLKPAIAYIENHYSEKITLKQLAQVCNVSESYLSRLFPKYYGQNVTEYMNTVRIAKAKTLLSNPEITVNYIARVCGYEDSSYFIKCFKKLNGVTPQAYRKALG